MIRVFVYGGLMYASLIRRKGIAAKLDNYYVSLTVRGIPIWEPSFAELVAAPGKVAWGVMAELTISEWHRLRRHEISYNEKKVTVQTKDNQYYECITLIQKRSNVPQEVIPSARYARLLYLSAKNYQFPPEVIVRYKDLYERGKKITLYTRWMMPLIKLLVPYVGGKKAFYICFIVLPLLAILIVAIILQTIV